MNLLPSTTVIAPMTTNDIGEYSNRQSVRSINYKSMRSGEDLARLRRLLTLLSQKEWRSLE